MPQKNPSAAFAHSFETTSRTKARGSERAAGNLTKPRPTLRHPRPRAWDPCSPLMETLSREHRFQSLLQDKRFAGHSNLTERMAHGRREWQPMLQTIQQVFRHHIFERAGAQLAERFFVARQLGLLDNSEHSLQDDLARIMQQKCRPIPFAGICEIGIYIGISSKRWLSNSRHIRQPRQIRCERAPGERVDRWSVGGVFSRARVATVFPGHLCAFHVRGLFYGFLRTDVSTQTFNRSLPTTTTVIHVFSPSIK